MAVSHTATLLKKWSLCMTATALSQSSLVALITICDANLLPALLTRGAPAVLRFDLLQQPSPTHPASVNVVLDRKKPRCVALLEQRQRGPFRAHRAIADAHLHTGAEAARDPRPMPLERSGDEATLPFKSCRGAACGHLRFRRHRRHPGAHSKVRHRLQQARRRVCAKRTGKAQEARIPGRLLPPYAASFGQERGARARSDPGRGVMRISFWTYVALGVGWIVGLTRVG